MPQRDTPSVPAGTQRGGCKSSHAGQTFSAWSRLFDSGGATRWLLYQRAGFRVRYLRDAEAIRADTAAKPDAESRAPFIARAAGTCSAAFGASGGTERLRVSPLIGHHRPDMPQDASDPSPPSPAQRPRRHRAVDRRSESIGPGAVHGAAPRDLRQVFCAAPPRPCSCSCSIAPRICAWPSRPWFSPCRLAGLLLGAVIQKFGAPDRRAATTWSSTRFTTAARPSPCGWRRWCWWARCSRICSAAAPGARAPRCRWAPAWPTPSRAAPGSGRCCVTSCWSPGVAGGFGSVFGTPIAGAVFALELVVLGRLQTDTLVPAAGRGAGRRPVHPRPGHRPHALPGGAGAGDDAPADRQMAALRRRGRRHQHAVHRSGAVVQAAGGPVPAIVAGANDVRRRGGAWRAAQLLGTNDYLGLGVPTILRAFEDPTLPWYGFAAKLVLTAITLGAGFMGGEVTPLFFIGATLGNPLAQCAVAAPAAGCRGRDGGAVRDRGQHPAGAVDHGGRAAGRAGAAARGPGLGGGVPAVRPSQHLSQRLRAARRGTAGGPDPSARSAPTARDHARARVRPRPALMGRRTTAPARRRSSCGPHRCWPRSPPCPRNTIATMRFTRTTLWLRRSFAPRVLCRRRRRRRTLGSSLIAVGTASCDESPPCPGKVCTPSIGRQF